MKTMLLSLISAGILIFTAGAIPPVPEPGAIFYGKVTNASTNSNVAVTSMTWKVAENIPNGRTATLTIGNGIQITNSNGETWFIARLPFATTSVVGLAFDALPPSVFSLSATPVNYSRASITANGYVAVLNAPAQGNFSLPDLAVTPPTRSRVERVDLTITTTQQALYDAWATQYFGSASDPRAALMADPDNDGIPNLIERAQGTDPTKNSTRFQATGKISISGQDYFSFVYWLAVNATDTSITPEISSDLKGPWLSGPTNLVVMESVDEGNGLRRISLRDALPMSANRSKAFIHLNVLAVRP